VGEKVARIDELADGTVHEVVVGGKRVVLVRRGESVRAFAARCPHYGVSLGKGMLHDGRLVCAGHQAVFAADDGHLLEPPAFDCPARFEARVVDGDVFVDRPDDAPSAVPPPMADFDPVADGRTFAMIGGGGVAAAAVETLRVEGFQGRIVVIDEGERWPYDRPNLSKDFLTGELDPQWLPLRPASFYEKHGIERLRARVCTFDMPSRVVQLDDGTTVVPDAVLLAPGAAPRTLEVPGADAHGIFTLRSWDDAERLRTAAAAADRVVIVGGGFLGLEAAAALTERGLRVTVVGRDEAILARVFGTSVGDALRQVHEQRGTRFRLGRTVREVHGGAAVKAVVLDDGSEMPADLVVVAVGVRPATAFVHGVTLNLDGAVEVDDRLRVAPGVWAGGDAVRYPEPHIRQAVRIEHWRLALQHGRAAARNMAGRDEPFRGVPFFWTRQHDVSLEYAGAGQGWEDIIVSGDIENLDFVALYARGSRLLAAAGTRTPQIAAFAELMRADRLPPADELREAGAFDLTALLEE